MEGMSLQNNSQLAYPVQQRALLCGHGPRSQPGALRNRGHCGGDRNTGIERGKVS